MAKILIYFNALIMLINSLLGANISTIGLTLDADKLESSVSSSTNARIEEGTLTGAHAIVMQDNEIVLDKCYGLDGVGGSELKDNAIYRIASMTKPVTALALLIEHDRGNLNIYDDVSKYLPEFADMYLAKTDADGNVLTDENGLAIKGEKATKSIKVYQLVSHFSGVGEVSISAVGPDCTTKKAAEWLATQPLNFEPGSTSQYSTGAFDVAARIVEITSGMEFSEYLKVNIFDKLGMTDTTFEPSLSQWSRFVKVHNFENGKATNAETTFGCVFGNFPATYHAAGAALCSTAYDYLKFAQMLANGGKAQDGTVIVSENTLKLLSTAVSDNGSGTTLWGLGVRVIAKPGDTLPVGSYGWSGAYGSHFWIDPTNNIVAVYMKNSAYDGGAGNKSASEFEEDVMDSLSFSLFG